MNREQFELKKLKIEKGGKVLVSYKKMINKGGSVYADTIEVDSPRVPHPDLENSLKELVGCLAESNDLYIHRKNSLLSPKQRESLEVKDGARIMSAWDKHIESTVHVSGISLQGDLETGSVVITGKRDVHNTAVAMNSPKINFTGDTFGIESQVLQLVEEVNEEAYLYIFENKSAQTEMEFEDGEGVESEEEEEETVGA